MSKRAVHMYEWDGGTESDQDMPDEVLCGTDGEMADEQLTNDWQYVTCKRCLRIRAKELAAQAIEERDQKAKLFDEAQAISIELGYRNVSTAIKALRKDAERYRVLRQADVDTIHNGGLFAGLTPDNVVINGLDLDIHTDAVIASRKEARP
ncbi:hypothetical protein [Pseudomonas putida]|uniref:hypothetical protein n=1 Tax=Pseudomonas putida TaxID=303 RepID=UPI00064C8369|nr:hypothetical protein [Pseudomonas putida]